MYRISFDPVKRLRTLDERGLDFEDAPLVFAAAVFEVEDDRRDDGERRMVCFGWLAERLVVLGYGPRAGWRHVFSMRKANAREEAKLRSRGALGPRPG